MSQPQEEQIMSLMRSISICRDSECAVPKKHPYYPVPELPPFYFGKRPCMAVVPTNLATNKIMVIGEYPNCRFGSVPAQNGVGLENFVPVADINEPFESGRYFDGQTVRDYPTEGSLYRYYFEPLQLDVRKDVWLTNINKCFLLRPIHIKNYRDIGWEQPQTEASYVVDDDYFDIASVCVTRHLVKEIQLCNPKLIIALGAKTYRMIHSRNNFTQPAADIDMDDIVGEILPANDTSTHAFDRRDDSIFKAYNVVHLFHPSYFIRGATQATIDTHLNLHIKTVKNFIDSLNL